MIQNRYEISCILQTNQHSSVIEGYIQRQGDSRFLDMGTLVIRDQGSFGQKHLVVRTYPVDASATEIIRRISSASNGYIQGTPVVTLVGAPATSREQVALSDQDELQDEIACLQFMIENFPEGVLTINAVGNVVFDTRRKLTEILGY